MVKTNSAVFISGAGTNLKYLIKNSREYNFPINIRLIISNKKNALGLNLAKKFSILAASSALFELDNSRSLACKAMSEAFAIMASFCAWMSMPVNSARTLKFLAFSNLPKF